MMGAKLRKTSPKSSPKERTFDADYKSFVIKPLSKGEGLGRGHCS